jgi:hypothetical protein
MKKNIALLLIIVCTGQSYAAGEAKRPDFGTPAIKIKQNAGDLEEFPLDSDEGIDEVTDSEFLKYLEPSIEEKEIGLIVDEIKKRNDDYAEDLEEFTLDSDERIDEGNGSEFLKYLEPSIEEKEIGLIVEEIKKRNDDYAEENKALRSEKEKYKGKVDAIPAFLEALNHKHGFLSNQLGSAEIKEDIDQFVRTLGTQ